MKAVRYFLIKADKTHKDKEGSIEVLHRFENQSKAISYHKILAVPKKYQHMVEEGDMMIHHFNVMTYARKDGVVTPSPYKVDGDLYRVPINMVHFVIRKNGEYVFFSDDCLVTPKGNSTETVRASGIIMPDLRTDTEKKDTNLYGEIFAKCKEMTDVEVGDRVCMSKYSDYDIELPNGETKWFVNRDSVLYTDES